MSFWVYIICRTHKHKNRVIKGFTSRYALDRLVYFEAHRTREDAKLREKQIKEWKRDWDDLLSSLDK